MSTKFKITGALAAAAVCMAPTSAAASGKTVVYGGEAEFGGRVAMDVKFNKDGSAAKKITELRAVGLPGECKISGPDIPLNATLPTAIKVSKSGRFTFEVTDAGGNKSTLEGKFGGRKDKRVDGTFVYASHFEAEGPYPEEDCATPKTSFEMKKGGKDVVEPAPQ